MSDKKPTEKERLEADMKVLIERARKADAALEELQRRVDGIDAEIADAASRGDEKALAELTDLAVELPIRLHSAKVAAKAVCAAREKKAAELGEVFAAERKEKLAKDRAVIDDRAAEASAELGQGMEIIGLALAKYDRLADEAAAVQAQLATLGQQAGLLPRWTDVVEKHLQTLRPRTGATRSVNVPVLVR